MDATKYIISLALQLININTLWEAFGSLGFRRNDSRNLLVCWFSLHLESPLWAFQVHFLNIVIMLNQCLPWNLHFTTTFIQKSVHNIQWSWSEGDNVLGSALCLFVCLSVQAPVYHLTFLGGHYQSNIFCLCVCNQGVYANNLVDVVDQLLICYESYKFISIVNPSVM